MITKKKGEKKTHNKDKTNAKKHRIRLLRSFKEEQKNEMVSTLFKSYHFIINISNLLNQ